VRFVLAFPDAYEVGMSHLGYQLLYAVLNDLPWCAAERAYAPWPDMDDQLRRRGLPLATLETGTPLAEADVIGFTLQYALASRRRAADAGPGVYLDGQPNGREACR
jgi:hypothetical protein